MTHTHEVVIAGDRVHKTYVGWDRDEPQREWAGLEHLAEHAPGLAPEPIERSFEGARPVVVMSRIAGEPLTGEVSGPVFDELVVALGRLFAVPVPADVPIRAGGPAELRRNADEWSADSYDLSPCTDPDLVAAALAAARGWLERPTFHDDIVDPVVALGDGNLDNIMWDGQVCRLIDWEEYGASDLTYELADLVEHASSRLERRLDVDRLLAAMDLTTAQQTRLREHRRILACFWLAILLPGNGGFTRNRAGSVEDQARHVLEMLG